MLSANAAASVALTLSYLLTLPFCCTAQASGDIVLAQASNASSNQIWFIPQDPVYRSRRGFPDQNYADILRHPEQWKTGLNAINVFGIERQMVEFGNDDLLRQVGEFARKYNKSIDIELPMNTYGANGCGLHPYIESYANKGDVRKFLLRLKKDGVVVNYITMDEIVWFGHFFQGRITACKDPLDVIVKHVAENVRDALEIFPEAKIGENEPFTGTRGEWATALAEWFEVYHRELGFYPKYLHADMLWNSPLAMQQMQYVEQVARSKGIRFGVIYDGDAVDRDPASFANKAVARAKMIEAETSSKPDAVIMSWMFEPETLLPESSCSSQSGILLRYLKMDEGEQTESCN